MITENAKFGNRGILCTSVMFLFAFILALFIGVTGPQVLQSRSDSVSTLEVNDIGDAEWIGSVNDMIQLNQLFWLSVKVLKPGVTDDIGVMETYVNVTGYSSLAGTKDEEIFLNRHDKHSIYCTAEDCSEFYIFGQSTIRHRSYDVHIRFSQIDSKFIRSNGSFEVLVHLHTINSEVSLIFITEDWCSVLRSCDVPHVSYCSFADAVSTRNLNWVGRFSFVSQRCWCSFYHWRGSSSSFTLYRTVCGLLSRLGYRDCWFHYFSSTIPSLLHRYIFF